MSNAHTFLYIWDDRFLFAAPSIHRQPTHRYSVNLLVSISGQPFHFDAGAEGSGDFHAVLIAPNVVRSVVVPHSGFISLNLDPESLDYHSLMRVLGERRILPLAMHGFSAYLPEMQKLLSGQCSGADAFHLSTALIGAVSIEKPTDLAIDMRVLQVARVLRSQLPITPPVAQLAASVGLSPSRLMHLFTKQMCMPMKSYVLWARMRRATFLIQSGLSLTEVAHQVGFSDQAHFSRNFLGFFGLNPSFLDRSSGVQVFVG